MDKQFPLNRCRSNQQHLYLLEMRENNISSQLSDASYDVTSSGKSCSWYKGLFSLVRELKKDREPMF